MNLGRAIKTIRAASGVSQTRLASLTDLDRSYLSMLESGSRSPGDAALKRICRALDVPVELMTLMSADQGDLRGLRRKDVNAVGLMLIRILAKSRAHRTPKS